MTELDIIAAVVQLDDGVKKPTPRRLEVECNICETDWRPLFGTWDRLLTAAGLRRTPLVRRLETAAGQHHIDSSGLTELDARVKEVSGLYRSTSSAKKQWILNISDVHDIKCDPFWLRVVLETVRITAPNVHTIVLNGDIWDGFEFARYERDFRQWQLGRRINFVHNFLAEIRKYNPHAMIVFVEGNHEHWILRYFNERAPELMALFNDLHGFNDVSDLLGIHKFGIHYCSQARLALPTPGQVRKEVKQHNYWVFKDTVMFTHYRPSDKNVTQPGVNGHVHRFEYRSGWYRSDIGRFGWLQAGCGSRMLESWGNGEKWERGFAFVEWDEEDVEQRVKMHPIFVSDSAHVFGVSFTRDPRKDLELYGRLGGFTEAEINSCYRPAYQR